MASSSRKRPADLTWETREVPKLSDTDSVATASENRNKQIMNSYSVYQRQNLSDIAPHNQRDFDLDPLNTLPEPKAVSTGTSELLQTDAILPSQEPVLAVSNPSLWTYQIPSAQTPHVIWTRNYYIQGMTHRM
ncbi:hypothetical protein IG631_08287 [Alternaria alternata]|nr:hypothetical protein IG631_08287 [Alternaria alternata]